MQQRLIEELVYEYVPAGQAIFNFGNKILIKIYNFNNIINIYRGYW